MSEPRTSTRPSDLLPEGFLIGAATSSHQVEGGNRWNDWWAYEQAGRLPYASGDACRHYDLFEADFDLAREMGHTAHRFSIEWSRIEPSEGSWNEAAIEHYRTVIEALLSRGLEPIPTLHHFTLPAWALARGGWTRRSTVDLFGRYVQRVVRRLGRDVRYWMTINEPTVYVKHAYVVGDWPPCRRRRWISACRVLSNLAHAHRAARSIIRAHAAGASVGFAHSAPLIQPCDPSDSRDRIAAWIRDVALNRAFFWLLGRDADGSPPLDFLGLNYYTRTVVQGRGGGRIPLAGRECTARDHDHGGDGRSDNGWEVYPEGLLTLLRRFSAHGVPILVTENGLATSDEQARTRFFLAHLRSISRALEEGIDVRAYLYWTLMDNFEWTLGTTAKFGLFEVDFETQERRPRPIVRAFRDARPGGPIGDGARDSEAPDSRTDVRLGPPSPAGP